MVTANQKIRRLPGFRFEAQAASRENVLPRMDIALFVGFAASGPVGIPVVLESAEQFNTIFGKDLPLVWDREKGETVYAYLAPTVRAFFRNGGKRCWVIRVARLQPTTEKPANRACYNFFPLSGLACVRFDKKNEAETILPAFARARSRGSWSDDLQVGTAVLARAVRFIKFDQAPVTSPSEKQKILYLEIPVNEPLKIGELLRLNFSDEGLILFLSADKIEEASLPNPPSAGKRIVKIISKRFFWVENSSVIFSPPAIISPPDDVRDVQVRMWAHREATSQQNILEPFFIEREAELRVDPQENKGIENAPPKIILEFKNLPLSKAPAAGSLLTTELADKVLCLMQVEMVNVVDFETQANIEVTCRAMIYREDADNPVSTPNVERLAFELWVKNGKQSFVKLSDLAFNSGHERFWGNLPTDEQLYRFSVDEQQENPELSESFEIPAWTQIGDTASFPLAGNGDFSGLYFPIFPTAFPEDYLGSVILNGTKLQRDGLEEFDIALFLDEKLENTGLNNLLNDAEFVRYLSARPRALRGIHAALVPETTVNIVTEGSATNPLYTSQSLEEATIISVPDALHRGWFLQKDDDDTNLPSPIFPPPLRPEWWHFQDCRKPEIKPVSEPLWENFLDCGLRVIKKPENLRVKEAKVSTGKYTLVWNNAEEILSPPETLKFVLEESTSPEFRLPNQIYAGEEMEFQVSGRGAGIYYYRVRLEIGTVFSDWSVGLAVKVPAAENWVANSTRDYDSDVLFAVQRALLRMCAARGDLFAVLDLPEHYDKDAAITHVATLKMTKGLTPASSGVAPFSADESRALSFGAVYHPWLMTREDGFGAVRNVPPSGNICGVMAHRAIQRGAWIAPANEALQGVFGLATAIERESFLDFQDGLVNLVRQEPTGFLVLDSDTLSDDFDLRSINVRRLLSLLRRLALKRGAEYVFEPNDERFRRQVQRGFASLLDVMFTRGAFAGTTPATSYQVVVSDTVNTFQSVEQGRFIVELRIAPSQPLKFVTVRLMQTGGRSTVTEVF